jgi:hypothetical protein
MEGLAGFYLLLVGVLIFALSPQLKRWMHGVT